MDEQKSISDIPQSGKINGIHNAIVADIILVFIAVVLEYVRISIAKETQYAIVGCFPLVFLLIIIAIVQSVADKKLKAPDVDVLKKGLAASGGSQVAIILISPILFLMHYAVISFVPGVIEPRGSRVEEILSIVTLLSFLTNLVAFFILPIIIKIKTAKIKKELSSSPQKTNPEA